MNLSLYPTYYIVVTMFILMVVTFILGKRLFLWRKKRMDKDEETNFGAVEGSLLGLLALMLSFTFSMSNSHYEKRVSVTNEEANDISTAILRADLYPDSIRLEFRKDFRRYLETRIEFFEAKIDVPRVRASLVESARLQKKLWERAAYYGRKPEFLVQTGQMVPALNAMFDIVTTRNTALLAKVPDIILYILFLLCIISAFTIGYTAGHKVDWIMNYGFAFMICITLFLIMDLDRERRGFITVGFAQKQITDLRSMFEKDE